MKILVVGGAGYIGSHMVKHLLAAKHDVVIADNFSTGFRSAIVGGEVAELDIADAHALDALFKAHRFDAVMHFASFIQVGESVRNPGLYYSNNVAATITLLRAMIKANVLRFIFSSTAAVYGKPIYTPIDEAHPKAPINPYGRSKWMVEQILEDFDRAYGLRSICLRYFNAAGADPDGQLGERHEPETHLIPLCLQVAAGRQDALTVFGQNYPTSDGTCIRDYIHVSDLVNAHACALTHIMNDGLSDAFNLGNGNGFSVKEVIDTAAKVTGRNINVKVSLPREGDPPVLVANAARAHSLLRWTPQFSELEEIIRHAWAWELKSPWS